jgi:hypothetical protein
MSNKLKERQAAQAMAVINDLIIPSSEKLKLKTIAKKSIKLTQEETTFWNSFSNREKSYILIGVIAQSLHFTEYQRAVLNFNLRLTTKKNSIGKNQICFSNHPHLTLTLQKTQTTSLQYR